MATILRDSLRQASKEEATTVVSVVSKPWITKTLSTVSDMSSFPWNSAAHLSQKGSQKLHGICRPPALMCKDPDASRIEEKFLSLVNSLVEIIQISYSNFSNRNPRNILRLYNQCFTFAILSRNIFGNPAKLTLRKFFGSHFHSTTVHLPETYGLFCLRSIILEQEERSFGDLRRISH